MHLIASVADPAGVINSWWGIAEFILAGFGVMILTGLGVKAHADQWVKIGVAVALSTAAALITAFGFDWSAIGDIPAPELVERAIAIWGTATMTYKSVDWLIERQTGEGVNERLLLPEIGLGGSGVEL